jgi:hypothetical protein
MIACCEVVIVRLSTSGREGHDCGPRGHLFDDLMGSHNHEGEYYK